jgi:hypothetical protein
VAQRGQKRWAVGTAVAKPLRDGDEVVSGREDDEAINAIGGEMKKLTLIMLTVVVILGAAAFASTRLWAASPAASSPRILGNQACGQRDLALFGHVKSLAPKGDHLELQFDPAWFTSGLTASRAKLQDTGYGDVPNDNYVVDEGHRLLAYILPANAHITVLTREGRPDSAGFASTAVTPSQLAELLAGKEPVKLFEGLSTGFWLHVHVDTVCSLEQKYQP